MFYRLASRGRLLRFKSTTLRRLVDLKWHAFFEFLWSPSLALIILRKLYCDFSIDFLGKCWRDEAEIWRRDSKRKNSSIKICHHSGEIFRIFALNPV